MTDLLDANVITCPSGLVVRATKLKVKQYKLLANRKMVESGEIFEQFLMSCAHEVIDAGPAYPKWTPGTQFNWKGALQGDRFATILGIRRVTHVAPFDFDVRCSACGKEFGWTVDLKDMPVVPYPTSSIKAFASGQNMSVLVDGRTVTFRLMTGAEEERLRNHLERIEKSDKRTRQHAFDPIIDSAIARFVSVSGLDAKEVRDWYEELDAEEALKISRAVESTAGGVETTLTVMHSEDPRCGGMTKIELPFASKDFWIPKGPGLGTADGPTPHEE